jgi:dGTPase
VLKQFTYQTTIYSSKVSLAEFRGYEVVQGIFGALSSPRGQILMPDDVRQHHAAAEGDLDSQMRIVCDFVAGMTDRYAIEFFGRLHSDNAQSMFKPL